MMMSYYKSTRADKASDYEDIWEKSPVPELELPELPPVISPTISEHRFKQFLFDKVFDKNTAADSAESHLETETENNEDNDDDDLILTSDPSYPTCSSSGNISSSDNDLCHNSSSSISSYSTDSSDICDDVENTEDLTDPLAALENLTDCDTDNDLEEFDDCDSDIEIGDANTLPIYDNDTSEKKEEIISNATVESVEKQALSENSLNDEQSCKVSTSGSLTGLLRKLSIRRKPSFTRSWSRSRQVEKRLSAVIGCYLTPDLLGMTNEECQVDSSSWEFLDQSKEPGMEYFLQSGVRQRTPSPVKPDITSDDSTLDSLYHSDESDQLLESSNQNKPVLQNQSVRLSRSIRGSVARSESQSLRSSATNVPISPSSLTQCTVGGSPPSTFPQCNVRVNDPEPQKQESIAHTRSHSSASSILCYSLSDLVTKNSNSSVAASGRSSTVMAGDSPMEVSAKSSSQESATLTEERHRRSDTGAGAAVIKSYLRQLSSSETSVLGQIVR